MLILNPVAMTNNWQEFFEYSCEGKRLEDSSNYANVICFAVVLRLDIEKWFSSPKKQRPWRQ